MSLRDESMSAGDNNADVVNTTGDNSKAYTIADKGTIDSGDNIAGHGNVCEQTIIFRSLRHEDAERVAGIEAECFAVPWKREDFWREAESEHSCYVVAIMQGEIIGYAGSWISFDEAQIINIAVSKAYRQRGLSKLLMHAMIAKAKARGARAMTLEVRPSNEAARRLYLGLGFVDSGVRKKYYEDGEDAIIMWHTALDSLEDIVRLED